MRFTTTPYATSRHLINLAARQVTATTSGTALPVSSRASAIANTDRGYLAACSTACYERLRSVERRPDRLLSGLSQPACRIVDDRQTMKSVFISRCVQPVQSVWSRVAPSESGLSGNFKGPKRPRQVSCCASPLARHAAISDARCFRIRPLRDASASNSSTTSNDACSTGTITSCARRSRGFSVKAALPRFPAAHHERSLIIGVDQADEVARGRCRAYARAGAGPGSGPQPGPRRESRCR
jgi:hypothetical protein